MQNISYAIKNLSSAINILKPAIYLDGDKKKINKQVLIARIGLVAIAAFAATCLALISAPVAIYGCIVINLLTTYHSLKAIPVKLSDLNDLFEKADFDNYFNNDGSPYRINDDGDMRTIEGVRFHLRHHIPIRPFAESSKDILKQLIIHMQKPDTEIPEIRNIMERIAVMCYHCCDREAIELEQLHAQYIARDTLSIEASSTPNLLLKRISFLKEGCLTIACMVDEGERDYHVAGTHRYVRSRLAKELNLPLSNAFLINTFSVTSFYHETKANMDIVRAKFHRLYNTETILNALKEDMALECREAKNKVQPHLKTKVILPYQRIVEWFDARKIALDTLWNDDYNAFRPEAVLRFLRENGIIDIENRVVY